MGLKWIEELLSIAMAIKKSLTCFFMEMVHIVKIR